MSKIDQLAGLAQALGQTADSDAHWQAIAKTMQELFGKDNYFVELMDHDNAIERRVRNDLLDLAKKIGAPIVATNDSHYVGPQDGAIQDAMLCINSGSTLQDPNRFTFDGTGYHLRSSQEMWDLFGDVPGACENALLIAERCNVSFTTADEGANYMPVFPTPEGPNTQTGLFRRLPSASISGNSRVLIRVLYNH